MTKTQMPEPVAWLHEEGDHIITAAEKRAANASFARYEQGLITTTQAEAYADARVREALEAAAKVPRAYAEDLDSGPFGKRHPEDVTAIFNASTNMADRIRALIPQENK